MAEVIATPTCQRSCLYECEVMHHRLSPTKHHFKYQIFLFSLDLDEIDAVAKRVFGFSRNRFDFYTFRDSDHLPMGQATVKENVTAWLLERGVSLQAGSRVQLITLPRVLGYIFNPVSFYFCFGPDGFPVCAVVQVGNTFGEMKPYLIRQGEGDGANLFRLVTAKNFYVSPFSELDLAFDFQLKIPEERLDIHIDVRRGDEPVLLSALTGNRKPLDSATLAWCTLRYPFITLKVITLIHWHALLLWLKKLPFHRKEDNIELQTGIFHPHQSLTKPATKPKVSTPL